MNIFNIITIFVILWIVAIIYFTYTHNTHSDYNHREDRVRCPPKNLIKHNKPVQKIYLEKKQPSETITLYDDNDKVNNKGFVNELIYKPTMESPRYDTMLIENTMQLNDSSCKLSSDLPLGNINVNYMLKNNTSKINM